MIFLTTLSGILTFIATTVVVLYFFIAEGFVAIIEFLGGLLYRAGHWLFDKMADIYDLILCSFSK